MVIPVPPRSEQDDIVEHIEKDAKEINTAISRTEREIGLMQEYRTRLTADVVTGKLDVRGAAAKLPASDAETPSAQEMPDGDEEPDSEEADE